jgi:hypothetical protein
MSRSVIPILSPPEPSRDALSEGIDRSKIAGMTMVRKTVTLDAKAVEGAMELSNGNLSAYVNEAVMTRVRRDRLKALVALDIELRGPIDEEAADAQLAEIDAVRNK